MADKNLPESQHQRWIKYGLNVTIATIVVVALAVCMMYLTQTRKRRFDTSGQSVNSLKEQTRNILKDLKSNVTLVSLYTRTGTNKSDEKVDYVGQVEDLLDEYKRNSKNIDVELIDPVASPTKVDDLIHKVTEKYGGEVKKYKEFLDGYPAKYDSISKVAKVEAAKVAELPFQEIKTQDLAETVMITISTVQGFPKTLETGKQRIDRQLKQKPPDYKGATDAINSNMSNLSEMLARIIDDFKTAKDNPKVPDSFRKYMSESLPTYEGLKKDADGIVDQIGKLGELKLDSLRQSLRERNSILVMGENDLKVLPFDKVWQGEVDRQARAGEDPIKPKFAGEQQISTAIRALTSVNKPKVVFMRPGGPPITERSPFSRGGGSFAAVADRLREDNFTVLEKDFTGMWAMQSQMQGMPATPEPGDDEIKDAVWIVFDLPTQSQMGMPPPSAAAKLTEHLANGGSALVLTYPDADKLEAALSPWGVAANTNLLVLKPAVASHNDREGDFIQQAERLQYVFILNNYGDHPLAKPLQSLDSAIVPVIPISITKKEGYTATPLLPIPPKLNAWGSSSGQTAMEGAEVKYAADKGDMAGPIYAGAAVEKKDGGRLVVLGTLTFATDQMIAIPDEDLRKQGYRVPRFPGNAELFTNTVYWLAKMDSMIAISPSATQVSRIAPMSDSAAKAWSVGVLLVGLPGLVIVAGLMMYFARRD
jgi:hypothetical protein